MPAEPPHLPPGRAFLGNFSRGGRRTAAGESTTGYEPVALTAELAAPSVALQRASLRRHGDHHALQADRLAHHCRHRCHDGGGDTGNSFLGFVAGSSLAAGVGAAMKCLLSGRDGGSSPNLLTVPALPGGAPASGDSLRSTRLSAHGGLLESNRPKQRTSRPFAPVCLVLLLESLIASLRFVR